MAGTTRKARKHRWEFKARFRRRSFGWRSRPPIERLKQAVSEIKRVARKDPVLGAEGAVALLERISPALEQVDSSSGSIGSAVNRTIDALVPIIAEAPAGAELRDSWLERLWEAHAADAIPYIECLADNWGELCASKEVASEWADRLVGITRMALSPDPTRRGHFHGTTACLSALLSAERYPEIIDILETESFWPYAQWRARALAAMGRTDEAIQDAEQHRGPWAPDAWIDELCEQFLRSAGRIEEAYTRYGLRAWRRSTHLATFRAICRRYPHREPRDILLDLARTTPGDEGKWFAAAKHAGLYDDALELAARSPCDPRTLTRAARDFALEQPAFAAAAGLLALHWIADGHGYEITGADVRDAYDQTMKAAEANDSVAATRDRVRQIVACENTDGIVTRVLGPEISTPDS